MAGQVPPLEIALSTTNGHELAGEQSFAARARTVTRAWESFAGGADIVEGVRPSILASWYRCRDQYEVDSSLLRAPGAPDYHDYRIEHDAIFTNLGGFAALGGQEVETDGGVVTVTDGVGRILGAWGDPTARRRADASNLSPWSSWSERSTGTNGMGTSFEVSGPVTVTGPEHWCEGLHQWACAGIAIRDVVTGVPIASINVSRWGALLPDQVSTWLSNVAANVEKEIYRRAMAEAKSVVSAFKRECVETNAPVLAIDRGGQVIAANEPATSMLGVPDTVPVGRGAIEPAKRWLPDVPELAKVVTWAAGRALQRPQWSGYAWIAVPSGENSMPVTLRPIIVSNHVVGMFCIFGLEEGEPYDGPPETPSSSMPPRVIGMRNDRLVLLAPSEIRYAEADRHIVWLTTDRGRFQAATRGLENVDRSLASYGFRRVHRRFLVNMRRVAELERGTNGELFLITDPRHPELVPVSRRQAPEIRRMLGL
ncbi:DNA-binding protein [Amycolatopsis alkalitolerans]|uniref:DNA-binding protein n=1 Tax=Amycolatopsis alkalitolerans TaxID=2547244 RepID=A0A5C4LQK0_9PSEU|nr:DNA-binding protein [Amycolatopsis alkalitolerans]TNC19395.1 DNA-binding protein [Amycolatopsis alkalitolerans]